MKTSFINPSLSRRIQNRNFFPLVTLLFQFVLFTHSLQKNSLHIDESRQLLDYGGGYISMAKLSYAQQQPPLDAAIGFIWTHTFGLSIFSSRFPSVFFSLIAVWFFQKLLRTFVRPVVAFISSLSLVIFPWFLEYSRYSRPYALVTCLFLAGLYLLFENQNKYFYSFLIILSIIPWARAVEGNIGFFLLVTALIIFHRKIVMQHKLLTFSFASFGLISVFINTKILHDLSPQYSQTFNFVQIFDTPLKSLNFIWAQLSYTFHVSKVIVLIGSLFILLLFVKMANEKAFKIVVILFLFGFLNICVIVQFSNIELISRYLYFLVPFLIAVLCTVLDAATKRLTKIHASVLFAILALLFSTIGTSEVNAITFPQFHQANLLVERSGATDANNGFYALMFSDIGEYLEPWPFDPGYPPRVSWLQKYVHSGGSLPKLIILMPPVDAGYNIDYSLIKQTRIEPFEFPKFVPLSAEPAAELVKLAESSNFKSKIWFVLAAIRANSQSSAPLPKESFREVCDYQSLTVDSGRVFGEWGKPPVSIKDLLKLLNYNECH